MSPLEIALLVGGGLAAGVVNTLAGGGSLLMVPLLVLVGLPGTVANGTNRVGILLQTLVAVWRFDAEGVSELRSALPLLLPTALGSAIGAAAVTRISDDTFEQLFALVMLVLLVPMVRGTANGKTRPARQWSPLTMALFFFAAGLYGGAIQAGLGIVLLFALSHSGLDLVRANAFKMVIAAALAIVAVAVFIFEGRISWLHAGIISAGYAVGAALGARIAVRGGERVIRPVLVAAVIGLAGHKFGLY